MKIDEMARLLVSVGYPRTEIEAVLTEDYGPDDVDLAIARAVAWNQKLDDELAERMREADEAAVRAEHDTTPPRRNA